MNKKHIFERMANVTDLNTEPVPGKPLVEIVSDTSVLIENHCGVISYSTDTVTVKTKHGCIIVEGEQLILKKMSCEQLKISGSIHTVELKRWK